MSATSPPWTTPHLASSCAPSPAPRTSERCRVLRLDHRGGQRSARVPDDDGLVELQSQVGGVLQRARQPATMGKGSMAHHITTPADSGHVRQTYLHARRRPAATLTSGRCHASAGRPAGMVEVIFFANCYGRWSFFDNSVEQVVFRVKISCLPAGHRNS
jgi:hypothetical protein